MTASILVLASVTVRGILENTRKIPFSPDPKPTRCRRRPGWAHSFKMAPTDLLRARNLRGSSVLLHYGAFWWFWWGLVRLGAVWCILVRFGAVGCGWVHSGAVWCILAGFLPFGAIPLPLPCPSARAAWPCRSYEDLATAGAGVSRVLGNL